MAPIPGMSLTKEPGNAPYEQPPLYTSPEEALSFYLKKFDDEEKLDDFLFLLENKLPLATFVDGLTSIGVMEGYHSIDVKVLLGPVLHDYIYNLCIAAGFEPVEKSGPSREKRDKNRMDQRTKFLLSQALNSPTEEITPEDTEEAQELLDEQDAPLIKRRE